ncbi:hypothetical protein AB4144_66575, partial [Rhizobiaceae sp. 2RAB30]
MHAGKVLISDTPAAIVEKRSAATLEEAFVAYLEDAIGEAGKTAPPPPLGEAVADAGKADAQSAQPS